MLDREEMLPCWWCRAGLGEPGKVADPPQRVKTCLRAEAAAKTQADDLERLRGYGTLDVFEFARVLQPGHDETLIDAARRTIARLAALEAGQDTGENGDEGIPVTREGVYWKERWKGTREMLAALEAAPVVPVGWAVRIVPMHGWCLGREGNGVEACPGALRALAWAIEHNARPPHAADEKGGAR